MNDITLITCSYNTPVVTTNMLKTFLQYHKDVKILVCENSTDTETEKVLKSANIPYIQNTGGTHGPSVDILLQTITTKYALLVDTDILFLKNCDNLFETFKQNNLTLMGEIVGDRGGKSLHHRVNPWFCFIDVDAVKSNNIKFFDDVKMKSRGVKRYDVGSSFFEDLRKQKLRIGDIKAEGVYYIHFEGMSWRVNKYGSQDGDIDVDKTATHNNFDLYSYGLEVNKHYYNQTQHLANLLLFYVL